SRRSAARRFGVGEATAIRWVERWRRTGSYAPDRMGSRSPRSPLDAHTSSILGLVDAQPYVTLAEIVAFMVETHGVSTSISAVDRFFARHGVTFKKRRRMPPSKSAMT
ncbi:MAG: hypothetical protein ACPGNT_12040, partial [Rhodospirillales bacterium]